MNRDTSQLSAQIKEYKMICFHMLIPQVVLTFSSYCAVCLITFRFYCLHFDKLHMRNTMLHVHFNLKLNLLTTRINYRSNLKNNARSLPQLWNFFYVTTYNKRIPHPFSNFEDFAICNAHSKMCSK